MVTRQEVGRLAGEQRKQPGKHFSGNGARLCAALRRAGSALSAEGAGGGSAQQIPSRSGPAAAVTGCTLLQCAFHRNADGPPGPPPGGPPLLLGPSPWASAECAHSAWQGGGVSPGPFLDRPPGSGPAQHRAAHLRSSQACWTVCRAGADRQIPQVRSTSGLRGEWERQSAEGTYVGLT